MTRFSLCGTPQRRTMITLSAVVAATVLVGGIQGKLSRRWGVAPDVLALGQELESLVGDVGDWQLVENSRLEPAVINILECVGHLKRTYSHRQTGESVTVAVMLGPPGPIAVHTPEICFSSRNYRMNESRERVELATAPDRTDSFWSLTFDAKNAGDDRLRVYYAWTTGRPWQASEHPRFQFSGQPCLYKIQLSCPVPAGGTSEATDSCRRFLEAFVPVLDRVLQQE